MLQNKAHYKFTALEPKLKRTPELEKPGEEIVVAINIQIP